MQPIHVADTVVGQALDGKSSITELCLADNEFGAKGMFVMRKARSDVRESMDSVVRQTWHSYLLFSLLITQTAKRPTSWALCDKEGRCFF